MKRILVVHSSGAKSGGEMISQYIYKYLKDLYSFSFFIPVLKEKSKFDCDASIFYPKEDNIFQTIRELRNCLKNLKPDIVNAHGTRAALFVKLALLTTKKRSKFIYTIHGFHVAHKKGLVNKIILFIENLTNFIFVDSLVCVGLDDYNLVREKSWTKKEVVLINNGVETPIQKSDEEIEKLREQNKFLILTICRLHYQKDVQTLIKSLSYIDQDVKLVIIGDGPQKEELKSLAENNKDKIIFLGNREDASTLIHYFDSFVLSTHWEGLPLVILEAMLSNVLVIGSNVHGVKELIKDNETGLLFKEKNALELAEKIKESFLDTEKRKDIVSKAFSMAKEKYSVSNMVKRYEDLYNK